MAMTRAQWNKLQKRLPVEDRTSYESYLASQGLTTAPATRTAAAEGGQIAAISMAGQTTGKKVPVVTATPEKITEPDPEPKRYYNYYTGEWVDSPDLIKPRTGMGGPESGGGTIDTGQFQDGDKTVVSVTYEGTGKNRVKVTKYSDGTETREAAPEVDDTGATTIVSTYTDPNTGDIIAVYSNGTTAVLSKGTKALDTAAAKAAADADAEAERKSAYDLLYQQFSQYGLGALVEPLKGLITSNISPSEFTIRLRDTDAYKKRFAANQARIQKGLAALSEADYIDLEDRYQNVMRQYGLPASYYQRGELGRQEGFEKLIANDVRDDELADRLNVAYNRVINAAPEILASLKQFYPDITNGDVLAYTLDPENAINNIKRKVTAAEIGGAATMAGLATGVQRAEELGKFGVTGEAYTRAAPSIKQAYVRGGQLAEFYKQQPFTQETAESAILNVGPAATSIEQISKLSELEKASYSGQSGLARGALGRKRGGAI